MCILETSTCSRLLPLVVSTDMNIRIDPHLLKVSQIIKTTESKTSEAHKGSVCKRNNEELGSYNCMSSTLHAILDEFLIPISVMLQ